jgi:hypothetical protein
MMIAMDDEMYGAATNSSCIPPDAGILNLMVAVLDLKFLAKNGTLVYN